MQRILHRPSGPTRSSQVGALMGAWHTTKGRSSSCHLKTCRWWQVMQFPYPVAKGASQFTFLFFSNRTLLGHHKEPQCGCHRGCNVAALERENPGRKEVPEKARHKDPRRREPRHPEPRRPGPRWGGPGLSHVLTNKWRPATQCSIWRDMLLFWWHVLLTSAYLTMNQVTDSGWAAEAVPIWNQQPAGPSWNQTAGPSW